MDPRPVAVVVVVGSELHRGLGREPFAAGGEVLVGHLLPVGLGSAALPGRLDRGGLIVLAGYDDAGHDAGSV